MDSVRDDILVELESALGHRFSDRTLLEDSLTHRSFLNEAGEKGLRDNERLEFFGDAVIDFFLSRILLERFPDSREGELTRIRASLVGEENLASLARLLHLGKYLKMGRGEEKSGGREKRSLLADAYEAVVAALYLDGGPSPVQRLVEFHFGPLLETGTDVPVARDAKTEFQELAQALRGMVPRYVHREPSGPEHARLFVAEVVIAGEVFGEGAGKTKKEAEQAAARAGLLRLRSGCPSGLS